MGNSRTKRALAVALAMIVVMTAASCGGGKSPLEKAEEKDFMFADAVTVEYVESEEIKTVNKAVTYLLLAYLDARIKTEEFAYESREEAKEKIDELAELWKEAHEAYLETEEVINTTVFALNSAGLKIPEKDPALILLGLIKPLEVFAAKEGTWAWAEDLDKKFNALEGASRYAKLAEQLGTDIKTAKSKMDEAQKMIHDDNVLWSMLQGFMEDSFSVISTSSKVSLFYLSTVLSGGITTVIGGAGVVAGGLDCIIDVADTSSKIFLGEDSQAAIKIDAIKETVSPVTTFIGLISLDFKKLGKVKKDTVDGLVYLGDSLLGLFQEGKVMGIKVFKGDSGAVIEMGEVEEAGVESDEEPAKEAGDDPGEKPVNEAEAGPDEEQAIEETEPGSITIDELPGTWSGTLEAMTITDSQLRDVEATHDVQGSTAITADLVLEYRKQGGLGFSNEFMEKLPPIEIDEQGNFNVEYRENTRESLNWTESILVGKFEKRGGELYLDIDFSYSYGSNSADGVYYIIVEFYWSGELKKLEE